MEIINLTYWPSKDALSLVNSALINNIVRTNKMAPKLGDISKYWNKYIIFSEISELVEDNPCAISIAGMSNGRPINVRKLLIICNNKMPNNMALLSPFETAFSI